MGLEPGDEVVVRIVDGEMRIQPRREAIKEAQAIVRKHIKKGRSLVKELSRERRKEAAHERVTGCEK
jgi:hypothetical protein